MSDSQRDTKPRDPVREWFEELGARLADWLAPLMEPPRAPVPVPARRDPRRR